MKYIFFTSLFLFLSGCVSFTSYDTLERLPFADLEGYEYQNQTYQPQADTTRFMVFLEREEFEAAFGKAQQPIDFSEQLVLAIAKYSKDKSYKTTTEHITYAQNEIVWLYETSLREAKKNQKPSTGLVLVDKKKFEKIVFVENGRTAFIISPKSRKSL